jgi:hypothetical protein
VSEPVVRLLVEILLVDEVVEGVFIQRLLNSEHASDGWAIDLRERLVNKLYLDSPPLGI